MNHMKLILIPLDAEPRNALEEAEQEKDKQYCWYCYLAQHAHPWDAWTRATEPMATGYFPRVHGGIGVCDFHQLEKSGELRNEIVQPMIF